MGRKLLASLIAGAFLIGAGIAVFNTLASFKPDPARADFKRPPITVRTLVAKRQDYREQVSGFGVVKSLSRIAIAAEVEGTIIEMNDDILEGALLGKGDLICKIDPSIWLTRRDAAAGRLDQIRANLSLSRQQSATLKSRAASSKRAYEATTREVDRMQKLVHNGAMAGSQLDTQIERSANAHSAWLALRQQVDDLELTILSNSAAVRSARADLEQATINLRRTVIYAPFTGTVAARQLSQGSRVIAGSALARGSTILTLIDPKNLELIVTVAARHAGHIHVGASATVRRSSVDEKISAKIVRIAPEINDMNRTVTIYMKPTGNHPLMPGQTIRATLPGGLTTSVTAVPRSAFVDNDLFVLRKQPDSPDYKVERRTPEVTSWLPSVALVIADILDGEHIVLTGINDIDHGSVVRLSEDTVATDQ